MTALDLFICLAIAFLAILSIYLLIEIYIELSALAMQRRYAKSDSQEEIGNGAFSGRT